MEQPMVRRPVGENALFALQVVAYTATTPYHMIRSRIGDNPDRLISHGRTLQVVTTCALAGAVLTGSTSESTSDNIPYSTVSASDATPSHQEYEPTSTTVSEHRNLALHTLKAALVHKSGPTTSAPHDKEPKKEHHKIEIYYGSDNLQEFGEEYVPNNIRLAYDIVQDNFPSFYSDAQMKALIKLWERESAWNHLIVNPESGAFGIAQSNPQSGAKMPTIGSAESQIRWGLSYIENRYGSPIQALLHSDEKGWY